MQIELTKKFRFESAHRLAKGYVGKCSNIHGHSWNGNLTVSTTTLDKFSMGVDYGILGKFLKQIEEALDHKLLVCAEDTELIEICKKNEWLHVEFAENPTSEAIAIWIFETAQEFFAEEEYAHVTVKSVTVEETCTTACTVCN